jgi:hypothetical protein
MNNEKYGCPPDPEEWAEIHKRAAEMNIPLESEEHHEFVDREGVGIDSGTPVQLWGNALRYFRWNKDNPIISKRKIQTGKEAGKDMNIEYQRPLTIKGLCLHCNISEDYLADIKNSKDKDNEFYMVVQKILYIIHTQNVEGAMVGLYESGFTAKVLNMEREEAPVGYVKVEYIETGKQLAQSENEILKKLDSELE